MDYSKKYLSIFISEKGIINLILKYSKNKCAKMIKKNVKYEIQKEEDDSNTIFLYETNISKIIVVNKTYHFTYFANHSDVSSYNKFKYIFQACTKNNISDEHYNHKTLSKDYKNNIYSIKIICHNSEPKYRKYE